MLNALSSGLSSLVESVMGESSDRYQLSLSQLTSSLSVFSIKADEQLNKPWYCAIGHLLNGKLI